jgi:hypothetical protein
VAVAAYAQDVDYFYIVLLQQICIFKDIVLTQLGRSMQFVLLVLFNDLVECLPTNNELS